MVGHWNLGMKREGFIRAILQLTESAGKRLVFSVRKHLYREGSSRGQGFYSPVVDSQAFRQ